ncbi:site-specific DNA-methyltransferase [Psychrobacter sanguinis]|uniref:site-specific DNA-methyltransferase n=1 Tax=Psychrobacter sanguinis TaxID=861445 RepID=UPI00020C7ABB|nr:site-specific DNA-methyltransferase [Psychrobacter sanguinis]EGK11729.1 type III restriction-modification system methyltransferase [Psychrobacter sp. 1501(2011)]MCD9151716.1 site-specific DNA-methyltransferase [Psychrobacter sanguinis]
MFKQDNLEMHSPNIVDDNTLKIAEIFPHCVTEARDDNGNLRYVVDFDLLRQELSQSLVEGGQERYRLDWPGKRQAILEANTPIAKTLRPVREESVNFDTTENLFIEGDNLEALKLLQESYLGQVKMIYIDPPYNTGNDFIYEDDFAEDTSDFLQRSEQVDEEGNRLVTNTESNGRFHSDWLTMMYSRLKLARNLLKDDGLIFISCDANEQANLKKIGDEIFGYQNFESDIHWRRRHNQPNDKSKIIARVSENILVYAKNSIILKERGTYYGLPLSEKRVADYKNPDNDPKGDWTTNPWKAATGRGGTTYEIITPTGQVHKNTWYGNKVTFERLIDEGRVHWTDNGNGLPRIKIYLKDANEQGQAAVNFFNHTEFGSNQDGSKELASLFGDAGLFSNPKPTKLISSLIKIATKEDDLILDFFAGSGTTADSTLQMNIEDSMRRKFILIQLDESTDEKSQAFKTGYSTISDLSKERIRRAGQKILEDNKDKKGIEDLDIGFRVLKIDSTNMKEVYYTPDEYSQDQLENFESHIKEDRTSEDLLFQVMLDWGVPLSLPIEVKEIKDHLVYYVGFNSLIACFDTLTPELVNEIAKYEPLKFVTSERAISHDQDKTNIKSRFAQLSPNTDVRFI